MATIYDHAPKGYQPKRKVNSYEAYGQDGPLNNISDLLKRELERILVASDSKQWESSKGYASNPGTLDQYQKDCSDCDKKFEDDIKKFRALLDSEEEKIAIEKIIKKRKEVYQKHREEIEAGNFKKSIRNKSIAEFFRAYGIYPQAHSEEEEKHYFEPKKDADVLATLEGKKDGPHFLEDGPELEFAKNFNITMKGWITASKYTVNIGETEATISQNAAENWFSKFYADPVDLSVALIVAAASGHPPKRVKRLHFKNWQGGTDAPTKKQLHEIAKKLIKEAGIHPNMMYEYWGNDNFFSNADRTKFEEMYEAKFQINFDKHFGRLPTQSKQDWMDVFVSTKNLSEKTTQIKADNEQRGKSYELLDKKDQRAVLRKLNELLDDKEKELAEISEKNENRLGDVNASSSHLLDKEHKELSSRFGLFTNLLEFDTQKEFFVDIAKKDEKGLLRRFCKALDQDTKEKLLAAVSDKSLFNTDDPYNYYALGELFLASYEESASKAKDAFNKLEQTQKENILNRLYKEKKYEGYAKLYTSLSEGHGIENLISKKVKGMDIAHTFVAGQNYGKGESITLLSLFVKEWKGDASTWFKDLKVSQQKTILLALYKNGKTNECAVLYDSLRREQTKKEQLDAALGTGNEAKKIKALSPSVGIWEKFKEFNGAKEAYEKNLKLDSVIGNDNAAVLLDVVHTCEDQVRSIQAGELVESVFSGSTFLALKTEIDNKIKDLVIPQENAEKEKKRATEEVEKVGEAVSNATSDVSDKASKVIDEEVKVLDAELKASKAEQGRDAAQKKVDGLKTVVSSLDSQINNTVTEEEKITLQEQQNKEKDELTKAEDELTKAEDELTKAEEELREKKDELKTAEDELREKKDELKDKKGELLSARRSKKNLEIILVLAGEIGLNKEDMDKFKTYWDNKKYGIKGFDENDFINLLPKIRGFLSQIRNSKFEQYDSKFFELVKEKDIKDIKEFDEKQNAQLKDFIKLVVQDFWSSEGSEKMWEPGFDEDSKDNYLPAPLVNLAKNAFAGKKLAEVAKELLDKDANPKFVKNFLKCLYEKKEAYFFSIIKEMPSNEQGEHLFNIYDQLTDAKAKTDFLLTVEEKVSPDALESLLKVLKKNHTDFAKITTLALLNQTTPDNSEDAVKKKEDLAVRITKSAFQKMNLNEKTNTIKAIYSGITGQKKQEKFEKFLNGLAKKHPEALKHYFTDFIKDRSVFKKEIAGLEEKKKQLEGEIEGHKKDIDNSKKAIENYNKDIENLEKEVLKFKDEKKELENNKDLKELKQKKEDLENNSELKKLQSEEKRLEQELKDLQDQKITVEQARDAKPNQIALLQGEYAINRQKKAEGDLKAFLRTDEGKEFKDDNSEKVQQKKELYKKEIEVAKEKIDTLKTTEKQKLIQHAKEKFYIDISSIFVESGEKEDEIHDNYKEILQTKKVTNIEKTLLQKAIKDYRKDFNTKKSTWEEEKDELEKILVKIENNIENVTGGKGKKKDLQQYRKELFNLHDGNINDKIWDKLVQAIPKFQPGCFGSDNTVQQYKKELLNRKAKFYNSAQQEYIDCLKEHKKNLKNNNSFGIDLTGLHNLDGSLKDEAEVIILERERDKVLFGKVFDYDYEFKKQKKIIEENENNLKQAEKYLELDVKYQEVTDKLNVKDYDKIEFSEKEQEKIDKKLEEQKKANNRSLSLVEAIKLKEKDIEKVRKQIKPKQEVIDSIQKQIDPKQKKIDDKEIQIQLKQDAIKDKKSEIENKSNNINGKEDKIKDLKRKIEDDCDKKIKEKQNELQNNRDIENKNIVKKAGEKGDWPTVAQVIDAVDLVKFDDNEDKNKQLRVTEKQDLIKEMLTNNASRKDFLRFYIREEFEKIVKMDEKDQQAAIVALYNDFVNNKSLYDGDETYVNGLKQDVFYLKLCNVSDDLKQKVLDEIFKDKIAEKKPQEHTDWKSLSDHSALQVKLAKHCNTQSGYDLLKKVASEGVGDNTMRIVNVFNAFEKSVQQEIKKKVQDDVKDKENVAPEVQSIANAFNKINGSGANTPEYRVQ